MNIPPLFNSNTTGGGRNQNNNHHLPPPSMSSPSRASLEEEKMVYKSFVNSFMQTNNNQTSPQRIQRQKPPTIPKQSQVNSGSNLVLDS